VTRDEAEELTALLAAAWASPEMPVITAKLFTDEFERLGEFELARQVIVGLYRDPTVTFRPHPGVILDGYQQLRHARDDRGAHERGLPGPDPRESPIHPDVLAQIERFLGHPWRPFHDMDDAA
jgi:hypothetical protein